MARTLETIRRANEEFDRVREYLRTTDGRRSIITACNALGISYQGFLSRISKEQKMDLMALGGRRSARFLPLTPDYKPKITPSPPRSVVIKTGPSPEAERLQHDRDIAELSRSLEVPAPYVKTIDAPESADPFGFPRIVYRMHKNFVGTWNCVKLSFFIRVEADVYFVVGYQYELSEFPGVFRADANLYDFNTDVNVAMANLRRVIDDKIGPVLNDKTLGLIQYGLEYVRPYDPRTIVAKTKIGAPDGDYTARVCGDIGRVDAHGTLYEFVIPENLPAGELPCRVRMNQVTLFV